MSVDSTRKSPASQEESPGPRQVGRSVLRLEDPTLLRGEATFAANVNFPRQLHMRVVRSDVAHGRIVQIDTTSARAAAGVVAVWTGRDVAEIPTIPTRATKVQGLAPYCQPILAQDRVRYVGEPVAVVFATDAYLAEDAAELVQVTVEELPPVLDAQAEPVAFDEVRNTEPTVIKKEYGDLEAAFAAAHAVIELELSIGRHSGVPMECRGAIARYDAARDVLEMHGAAKKSHWNRDVMAQMLGRSRANFHLFEGHVGGGFGVRGELYPEDVLVCLAALRLRRPVKWIEDRRENLMATNHSRQQHHRIQAAVNQAGELLGIRNLFFLDQGGYVRTHGARVADMSAGLLLGPYRVPAYHATCHYRLTNKTPCGTYRSPGRYETTFVRERLMDAIAERLGLDKIEVRRRNLVAVHEMPYARPLDALGVDVVLDSGDYAGLLNKTLARLDWDGLQARLAERRKQGELVGVGLAMFVEKSGLGPSDLVRLTVEPSGTVELITGAASVGQGMETVLAQICADELGIDYRRVRVVRGRTDRIEFGNGAHASRVTVMSGSATQIAARKVRALALEVAARALKRSPESLNMSDGRVVIRNEPEGAALTLAEIAGLVQPDAPAHSDKPFEHRQGLSADGWFYSDHMNYPYGVHVAQVCIDPDTGIVRVERYLVSYDVGRAVNPTLVVGQLVGGLAQGIGGALFEQFLYDPAGQPQSTTFADYLMVTASEMPEVDVLLTEDAPSPLNPLGMKGAGEGGTNAVGAAIAAAVDDALAFPGFVTRLPILPKDVYRHLVNRQHGKGSVNKPVKK